MIEIRSVWWFTPFASDTSINPAETGLYYLQSRYYDPEVGRFINADAFVSTGQSFLGFNMYAYCNNNPINFCDSTGCFATSLRLGGTIVASLSRALTGIMASISVSASSIKAAMATSWCVPICVAATAVAMTGVISVINRVMTLSCSAAKTIAAVKARVTDGGCNPKKLSNYTVYVITRKGTSDVVYVGITKNYPARKRQHTGPGKRFPTSKYTMLPIATGLSRINARVLEQCIITAYTIDTLANMINSISPQKWNTFTTEFNQMNMLIQSWIDPE